METLLIANAKRLRAINGYGVKKMLRNILALQQNIRTIAQESQHADFERAKRYYNLFSLTPRVRRIGDYITPVSSLTYVNRTF